VPFLLLVVACGPGADTDTAAATATACAPGDAPALLVATPNPVAPIEDGTAMDLVQGPQGGFHVEIGLVGVDLDTSATLDALLRGVVDGAEVARAVPLVDFSCDPSSGQTLARNLLLVLVDGVLPNDLDGATMQVEASLTDAAGREAVGSASIVVLSDP
jgi:hypothetical protein